MFKTLAISGYLFVAVAFASLVGCTRNPSSPEVSPTASTSDKDRPPLRIGLIAQSKELEENVRLRWGSVSDLRLEFISLDEAALDDEEVPKLDIVVAPTMLIGSLVEREWVSKLPENVVALLKPSEQNPTPQNLQIPNHWLSSVEYAKSIWGVPMGCSIVMLKTAKDDSAPDNVDTEIDVSVLSKYRFQSDAQSTGWNQADLVDQFLLIARTKSPDMYDSSPFFKLIDGSSRLNEAWLIEAAKTLRELHRTNSVDASLVELGWPNGGNELGWSTPTITRSNIDYDASGKGSMVKQRIVIDGGRGSAFFMSTRTRQSSKSAFFLSWLCEPSQKTMLAKLSPYSYSIPDGSAPTSGTYADAAFNISFSDNVTASFRMNNGQQYRKLLFDTLRSIISSESVDVEQAMQECSTKWDTLSNSLDTKKQKDSLERSLGLLDR
jgi:hypothetical protein